MVEAESVSVGTAPPDEVREEVIRVLSASRRRADQAAYQRFRSGFDIALACCLIVVLAPLLALIAIAIRWDTPGPVLFRQQRVGLHGRLFSIFKFRTMCVNAPMYSDKVDDRDPRVTAVGRFLRGTGLDELPQLLNVVRGDMALIGPRPEQAALLHHYQPWQLRRHSIKPGITGWWQVHHRGCVHIYDDVDKDLEYIDRQGPAIDLLVIALTMQLLFAAILVAVRARLRT